MGLDIVVMERKDVRCPHCGEVIITVDVASTDSGGSLWYDFLERLGYYVPYEKRTKENDWYGKDMVLDNEQAKQLADYAVKKRGLQLGRRGVDCDGSTRPRKQGGHQRRLVVK